MSVKITLSLLLLLKIILTNQSTYYIFLSSFSKIFWFFVERLESKKSQERRSLTDSAVAGGLLWVSGLPDPSRLRCNFCERDMKNEHSLNVHISRYHNQDSVPTQTLCPVCSKTYSNQYSLRTHMHLQASQKLQFPSYYSYFLMFIDALILTSKFLCSA